MKKLFIIICILLAIPAINMDAKKKNVNLSELNSLIKEYKSSDNFDSITIGGLGLSLLRGVARVDASGDSDVIAALSLLKGINQISICDYESCSDKVKSDFSRKVTAALDSCEVLMTAKDEGDSITIYGNVSAEGDVIRDVVLFSPENCALILLSGKLSMDDLAVVMESAK